MAIKFVNNFQTTLASAISAAATSITIASGDGARLGTLGSDVYYLTIYSDVSATVKEIVKVTARSTDTLTVVRAQDGTTAQAWSAGAFMEARLPKVVLEAFSQATAGVVAVADGGTGATTAAGARTNLGLGTIATQNSNAVAVTGGTISGVTTLGASAAAITGGTITGITDLAVADGGTGASTHTANAVLIGNGTSAITSVSPSTSGNVLTSNGTTWISSTPTSPITIATPQASTSGTSLDFTGIPSTAKRITVLFAGVSTSGSDNFLIQVGSGSVSTSGYVSTATGGSTVSSTAGFILTSSVSAGDSKNGSCVIQLIGSNQWVSTSIAAHSTNTTVTATGAGNKTTSGALDRIRLTTTAGTDTFDAGTVTITYES